MTNDTTKFGGHGGRSLPLNKTLFYLSVRAMSPPPIRTSTPSFNKQLAGEVGPPVPTCSVGSTDPRMLPKAVRLALDAGGSAPLRTAIKDSAENLIGLRLNIVEAVEDIARTLNFGALSVLVEDGMVVPEILRKVVAILERRHWVAGMALIARTTTEFKGIFGEKQSQMFHISGCVQTYRCPLWVGLDAPAHTVAKAAEGTDWSIHRHLDYNSYQSPVQLPDEAIANVRVIARRIRERLDDIMDDDGTFGYIEATFLDPLLVPHVAELLEKDNVSEFADLVVNGFETDGPFRWALVDAISALRTDQKEHGDPKARNVALLIEALNSQDKKLRRVDKIPDALVAYVSDHGIECDIPLRPGGKRQCR